MPKTSKIRKDRLKDRRAPNSKLKKTKPLSLTAKLSAGTLFSLLVIGVAFISYKYIFDVEKLKLDEVLSNLLRAEAKVSVNPNTKIAVGFGSCQDVIVQSKDVLKDLAPRTPDHFNFISTKEELLKVFAYFYQHGAAAERYVSNSTLFDEVVSIAERAPSAHYEMGGNAAIMAKRFAKEGCHVLLGAQMSNALRELLPKQVQISGPIIEEDDIHLLLEYPAGQRWGPYNAPRANRFIIHNDHQNPLLSSLEIFNSQIKSFNPNLLVVSGLQMMDNFPIAADRRQERLLHVQNLMREMPKSANIHFEMASFSDEGLLKNLVHTVIPYADSLGMNEQELPNLFQIMKYGNISLVSESYPRIAKILDEMRDVFNLFQETVETDGRRKLTRLHVHTLAFHALMVKKNSSWKNNLSALAKSVLTSNRHTCGSDTIDTTKAKLIMDDGFTTTLRSESKRIPFNIKNPISCWDEEFYEVCIAPVLVCTDVLQTGGGGDNVSSAGLVLQI